MKIVYKFLFVGIRNRTFDYWIIRFRTNRSELEGDNISLMVRICTHIQSFIECKQFDTRKKNMQALLGKIMAVQNTPWGNTRALFNIHFKHVSCKITAETKGNVFIWLAQRPTRMFSHHSEVNACLLVWRARACVCVCNVELRAQDSFECGDNMGV